MPPKTRGGGIVAVCTMEAARYSECSLAIARLELPAGWDYAGLFNYDLAHARNAAAATLVASERDHILYMDDDQVFEPALLHRLLSHRLPLVAPLVLNRRAPFSPCPIQGDGNTPMRLPDEPGLVEVDALGGSGLLVHRSVFESFGPPWFAHGTKDDGTHVSDDVWFTRMAKQAGFPLHVDTSLVMGHTTLVHITPEHTAEGWLTRLEIGGAAIRLPAYERSTDAAEEEDRAVA